MADNLNFKNIKESDIEKKLKERCEELGFMYLKFGNSGRRGVPDRIVIGNSKTVFVELKRPGQKPRAQQEYVIKEMKQKGAQVFVVSNFEEIDTFIYMMLKR